ncbi:MAG: hypothetical protein HOM25_16360 [Rhodospirillaceae bacterium]|jgi:hypothetical protein|nr:hypothetical protein [Rhodospirillaceae bacterium]MBT5666953.1 hypothetical protein [Rhodospirillaceae bacterium]MBT5810769.1 hypothetical protein [Rhodospirillaceae bacterium]
MTTAIDLESALAENTTFLEGRTRLTDTTGYFTRLADYRDGGIFAAGFSGVSQWERHNTGDEIVQILKGAVTSTSSTRRRRISSDKARSLSLIAGPAPANRSVIADISALRPEPDLSRASSSTASKPSSFGLLGSLFGIGLVLLWFRLLILSIKGLPAQIFRAFDPD